ncbi:unnamed protein product, partial [marine sediment metagenome]
MELLLGKDINGVGAHGIWATTTALARTASTG